MLVLFDLYKRHHTCIRFDGRVGLAAAPEIRQGFENTDSGTVRGSDLSEFLAAIEASDLDVAVGGARDYLHALEVCR